MSDIAALVEKYCAAWSEPDEVRRMSLLEGSFAQNGHYQDPTAALIGREALSDHIGAIHASSPGAKVEATSGIDHHNGHIRFTWHFVDGEGQEQIKGTDVCELSAEGHLVKIVGFFDPPPEL